MLNPLSKTASPIPFVLQRDFISVVLDGKVIPVSRGQATFQKLYTALERGQWSRVPKLVSLAEQIAEQSHGRVQVKMEDKNSELFSVYYKGVKVENSITAKILELVEHNKKVAHVLRFMDNLYQQPDVNTVNEVYEWLANGRFALTDDGCFVAYKKVDRNYKDIRTGKIDNHVGQVVTMPRKAVDPDRRNECSRGLHFCSKKYLPNFGSSFSSGDCHIMEIKVNPADVVAIPTDYGFTKGRTWRYEVLREVMPDEMIEGETDSPVMMQPVIEIAPERAGIIKQVKALPTVKRLMRRKKLTAASFSKASTPRLIGWLRKFSRMDIAPAKSKLFDNPLRFSREAAGLTMGQVAKAAVMELKDVYNAERSQNPTQEAIDKVLEGIAKAQGNTYVANAGVSYPRPAQKATAYQPSSSYSSVAVDDDDDGDGDEEDYDDLY